MTRIEMHFEGEWDIVIATPIGRQKVRLVIGDTDGRLTGTATHGDETVPFQNVNVDGDRLRWTQDVAKPFPLNVKFDVTLSGDAMSGTAKAGVFPASKLSGHRATASG
jgi:hypothetical protein